MLRDDFLNRNAVGTCKATQFVRSPTSFTVGPDRDDFQVAKLTACGGLSGFSYKKFMFPYFCFFSRRDYTSFNWKPSFSNEIFLLKCIKKNKKKKLY